MMRASRQELIPATSRDRAGGVPDLRLLPTHLLQGFPSAELGIRRTGKSIEVVHMGQNPRAESRVRKAESGPRGQVEGIQLTTPA